MCMSLEVLFVGATHRNYECILLYKWVKAFMIVDFNFKPCSMEAQVLLKQNNPLHCVWKQDVHCNKIISYDTMAIVGPLRLSTVLDFFDSTHGIDLVENFPRNIWLL